MDYTSTQSILLSILTSIITGGFIIVFIEIGNRKNREIDRYEQFMMPFMKKLTAYFRFISWYNNSIIYPKDKEDNVISFQKIVNEMAKYGTSSIMSGFIYDIDSFSTKKLKNISYQINEIWYCYDKMNPCKIKLANDNFVLNELKDKLDKELLSINPTYLRYSKDVFLISKVSGDFFIDIFQPIENYIDIHNEYMLHYRRQYLLVVLSITFVLLSLILMLFVKLPMWIMRIDGMICVLLLIISLLLLGVDIKTQIRIIGKFIKNNIHFL